MEVVSIILRLWRLKLFVALAGVLSAVIGLATVYHLPSGKPRSITFAAASTQILIDAPTAPLASSTANLDAFTSRAAVYARLMTSDPVRAEIAKTIGVDSTKVTAVSPVDPNGAPQAVEPGAERRAGELAHENDVYRLFFQAEQSLPIVAVYATAPTAKQAAALANSTPQALQRTLALEQDQTNVPKNARVEVKQLGRATGAVVNEGAGKMIAGLVFVVTFAFLCFLILVASRFGELWRMTRAAMNPAPAAPQPDGVAGVTPEGPAAEGQPVMPTRKRAAKRAAKKAPAGTAVATKRVPKRAAKRAARVAAAAASNGNANGHANGGSNGHANGNGHVNGNGDGHPSGNGHANGNGHPSQPHELTRP